MKKPNLYEVGVWTWGVLFAGFLVWGSVFVATNFGNPGSPDSIGTVLAAIIAALGVIWSWFFQVSQQERHHKAEMELERERLKLLRESKSTTTTD